MFFRQEKKITQLKALQDMFLILGAPDSNYIFLTVTGNIKFEKSSCESIGPSSEIKNTSFYWFADLSYKIGVKVVSQTLQFTFEANQVHNMVNFSINFLTMIFFSCSCCPLLSEYS